MELRYVQPSPTSFIEFETSRGVMLRLDKSLILSAINQTHDVLDKISGFEVDIFGILGMRNLSAFVGELFAAALVRASAGFLLKNPHQDGYPDLLPMDSAGKDLWEKLKFQLREKAPFSPFANGGIEVKATCGSLPTPAAFSKRDGVKPEIGDQRIEFLKGYDWKAHHRDTNNLIGLLWDFVEGIPRIVAVFFSARLTLGDWGVIIQPKDGGGRTTSVSIMTREGVRKMYYGCVYVLENQRYVDFLDKYNKDDLLRRTLIR